MTFLKKFYYSILFRVGQRPNCFNFVKFKHGFFMVITVFLFICIIETLNYYGTNDIPKFVKPEITKNLNCADFFDRNETERNTTFSKYSQQKISWKTPDNLPMSCKDIFERHYFSKKPLSEAEAKFPIAYTKNIYTDYFMMEQELATTYAPQNFYCFSMDAKATEIFKKQIHSLSSCFSNVFYTEKEFALDSKGHNSSYAQFECLKLLIKYDWKYVIMLLSHDIAIKTNAEIVQILTWLEGVNDVMMIQVDEYRIDRNYSWTFEEIKIFKDDSNNHLRDKDGNLHKLSFAKGMAESSLSRTTVDYLLNQLDLTKALEQFNGENYYANDENFIPTLLATEALKIPGRFLHQKCIEENGGNGFFTRKSNWNMFNSTCASGIWRHLLCIYGAEDLLSLENSPEMFANKMLPENDFGGYICWSEKMFNRTHGAERKPPKETLNAEIYLNHPAVRYNRQKNEPEFDPAKFECSLFPKNSSSFILAWQRLAKK